MKKFSIRLLLLAALISIAGTAFTPRTTHHLSTVKPAAAKASQCFYWFMEPMDYIDDYADLSYQISQMEIYTGGLVDTQPAGGILIESGYAYPTIPHAMWPQIGLYVHY